MHPTVLIVDDDPEYGNLIAQVAQLNGLTPAYCQHSSELTAILKETPEIELIFLDVTMPEPDGFEVMEMLSERKYTGYIVMMSGYDAFLLSASHELASDYGLKMLPYLQKPFSIRDIDNILTSFTAN